MPRNTSPSNTGNEIVLDPPDTLLVRLCNVVLALIVLGAFVVPIWIFFGPAEAQQEIRIGTLQDFNMRDLCGGLNPSSRLGILNGFVQMFWSRICG